MSWSRTTARFCEASANNDNGQCCALIASIFMRCSPFRDAVGTKYFANELNGRKAVSLSNRRPANRDCHNPRSSDLTRVEFRKHDGFDRVQKLSWPLIQTSRDQCLARSMRGHEGDRRKKVNADLRSGTGYETLISQSEVPVLGLRRG